MKWHWSGVSSMGREWLPLSPRLHCSLLTCSFPFPLNYLHTHRAFEGADTAALIARLAAVREKKAGGSSSSSYERSHMGELSFE